MHCKRSLLILFVILIGSCKKELSNENQPPVAVAGPDLSVTLPGPATLDGSQSYDPGGNIAAYQWTQLSGPAPAQLQAPGAAVTTATNLVAGTYLFQLMVTDETGLTGVDTVQVTTTTAPKQPPVANAGNDQVLAPGTTSTNYDGSGSTDPDGTIISYAWTQISGPVQSAISAPAQVSGTISNLAAGSYTFQLLVTDNQGATDLDTMQVVVGAQTPCTANRPVINAQLVPFGTLSIARSGIFPAAVGNRLIFAGGVAQGGFSTRADVYDFSANTWSTAEISQGRQGIAVTTIGTKAFFAGGGNHFANTVYDKVDIYDAATNTWSVQSLSQARSYAAAATVGDKVVIAGGGYWSGTYWSSDRVDIYDNTNNTWTTATLSVGRHSLTATTVNNEVYIAGGSQGSGVGIVPSGVVDVYDASANTWTTSSADTMSQRTMEHAAIADGNRIYWAGGIFTSTGTLTNKVEIRDVSTGTSTYNCLHTTKARFPVVKKNNQLIFFTYSSDNQFDIYDIATNTWKIGRLPFNLAHAAIITVNNEIYVAGGFIDATPAPTNGIWKLTW
ncbi:MAG TPA: kelch repeat-containing protein [Flavisolibacter sp.]